MYLLELHGNSIEEDSTAVDQDFLMEVMELNEELAAIDSAEPYRAVLTKNQQTLNELYSELSEAFNNQDIHLAKCILIRLKYYCNLEEKLRNQEHLYM